MSRSTDLASRLREVLLSGKWIANTNFREQIEHLDWNIANRKIGELNSVALLTFHIDYYLQGLLHVFNGGELEIKDKYSFSMSPLQSEEEWIELVNTFIKNAEQFVRIVEGMSDELLDATFCDPLYGTYLRNIEGVIEHSYYHLGQVTLIRKILANT